MEHRQRSRCRRRADRRPGSQRQHVGADPVAAPARHRVRGSRLRAGDQPDRPVPSHSRDRRRYGPAGFRRGRARQLRCRGSRLPAVGRLRSLESGPRSPEPHLGGGGARGSLPRRGSGRDGHRHARGGDSRRGSRGAGSATGRRAEHRAPPPFVAAGTRIDFGEVSAEVERVAPLSARLVELRFDRTGAALWSALYRIGRPVQYSHAAAPLELWHVQVGYASRPWAAEMPSAGRPLRWELLLALRRRGVRLASITHAAGLSATGDPAIDAALPMAERFEVPPRTAGAVAEARDRGGRVVAVGTSVVRALEGAASVNGGELRACSGETDLLLGPGYQPRVVGGLLTGVHERGASHYALLRAFASEEVLARASAHAEELGYLSHEF